MSRRTREETQESQSRDLRPPLADLGFIPSCTKNMAPRKTRNTRKNRRRWMPSIFQCTPRLAFPAITGTNVLGKSSGKSGSSYEVAITLRVMSQ